MQMYLNNVRAENINSVSRIKFEFWNEKKKTVQKEVSVLDAKKPVCACITNYQISGIELKIDK